MWGTYVVSGVLNVWIAKTQGGAHESSIPELWVTYRGSGGEGREEGGNELGGGTGKDVRTVTSVRTDRCGESAVSGGESPGGGRRDDDLPGYIRTTRAAVVGKRITIQMKSNDQPEKNFSSQCAKRSRLLLLLDSWTPESK